MELYAAMVENMDANIGKLIGYLKTNGLYDNTLIIFLSDNGPEGNIMEMGAPWDNSNFEDWGKKGTFIQYGPAWAQVGAGPLRMFKGFLSEGGIRTPLIISGKGVEGSGRISDAVTHVTDIPATILDAAGVAHPETFEGKKVAPLQGKSSCADPEQRERRGPRPRRLDRLGSSSATAPSGRATGSCCGCASRLAPANGSCST